MIETIELKINGEKYQFSKGITLQEVANGMEKGRKHPILLAKVDDCIEELSSVLTDDAEVEFLDLTVREGNRCHSYRTH